MEKELKKFEILRAAVARQYPNAGDDIVLSVAGSIFSSCASRGIEFIAFEEEKEEEAS